MSPENQGRELPIENKKDLTDKGMIIESLSDNPKVTSENDFDIAYNKWLKQKGVGLYDSNISIVNDGNQFLIGPKDGTSFKEYIRVDNINLLKGFIRYTTDHYYRDLFTSVHNNFNLDISSRTVTKELSPGIKTTQEVLTVVFKEELDQLKEAISFQQVIDGCKALTTWGTITLPNGTKEYYAQGQYQELRDLINTSKPKADDIIFKNNLEIFKRITDEQKEKVILIERQARETRNDKNTQNNADMLHTWKQSLDTINAEYTQIKRYITDPTMMNKPFDPSLYGTDIAVYSSEDIRKLQKFLWAQDIETNKIDEAMFNAALLKLDTADRQEFRVYLNEVIAGRKDPSKDKYIPKNKDKFDEIVRQYPALTGYINFYVDKSKFRPDVQNNLVNPSTNGPSQEVMNTIQNDPHYADWKEALAKGGIAGLAWYGLDKTNMTKEQKQMRWGVGQLAMTGAAIYVGWKMLSSAFNLITWAHKGKEKLAERKKDRQWILGPAAIVFGLQAATGEWVAGILHGGKGTDRLANIFGGSKDKTPNQEKKTQEFQTKYGENMVGSMSIFSEMNYGQLKKVLEMKDGKMKLKPESRKAFLEKFGTGNTNSAEQNPAGYKFLNDVVGANDDNGLIDLSLKATGTTRDEIQKDDNANIWMKEKYAKVSVKLASISAFLEEKWYSRINPDRMDKLEEYLSNPDATDKDLDKLEKDYTDMFIKGDIKNETGDPTLEDKIKAIAGTDKQKEDALMIWLNKFYQYMPNATKKIEIIGNWPELIFKTYDKETKININNKELIGFSPKGFDSYFELFKAASLTNYIKKVCKDKTAISADPFTISKPGADIEFDDAKVFSTKFDTEIISGGRGWALSNVSPTLEKYKQDYCDYLNNTTPKFWKEAVIV